MKTAGFFLKNKRKKLNLELQDISKKLKIDIKYLKALEEDNYKIFDSKVIARGFLIKYAKVLGLDVNKLEAFWRRDFKIEQAKNPFKKRRITYLSHNTILISILSSIIILTIVIGYLRYFTFKKPPNITIVTPKNESQVTKSIIYLEGKTSPEADLYLNNSPIQTDEKGNFRENIYLSPGVNNLIITAVNQLGIQTKKSITVYNKEPIQERKLDQKGKNELSIMHIATQPTFVEVKDDNKTLFSGYFIAKTQKKFYGNTLSLFTDKVNNLEIYFNNKQVDTSKREGEFFKKFEINPIDSDQNQKSQDSKKSNK